MTLSSWKLPIQVTNTKCVIHGTMQRDQKISCTINYCMLFLKQGPMVEVTKLQLSLGTRFRNNLHLYNASDNAYHMASWIYWACACSRSYTGGFVIDGSRTARHTILLDNIIFSRHLSAAISVSLFHRYTFNVPLKIQNTTSSQVHQCTNSKTPLSWHVTSAIISKDLNIFTLERV